MPVKDSTYYQWLALFKERIRSAQIKAAVSVNAELLNLYWLLGSEIIEKERKSEWGDKLIPQLSKDLLFGFPDMKGFSTRNLFYIHQWVKFYSRAEIMQQLVAQFRESNKNVKKASEKILQQPVAQMPQFVLQPDKEISEQNVTPIPGILATTPWGHHLQIITKCKNIEEALFYLQQTAKHSWSRNVMIHQIESGLYRRKGAAITNFDTTLPHHIVILLKNF